MPISKFLDPKNDIAFKKIFGEKNKDILIHFINDIMGFVGGDVIKEVTFLSPIQNPEISYQKQSVLDVLCKAENGTQIIVEMQASPMRGFEKRAQYYAAKAYSRQLKQGSKKDGIYANLKEVIFIAISDYNVFPDKKDYISHHVILDKHTYENDLKDFSFSFIELPKFPLTKVEELKTIIEKWCYFFKYAGETTETDFEKMANSALVIKQAYDALNRFNWTEDELIAYEDEEKRIMDNLNSELYYEDLRKELEGKAKELLDLKKETEDKAKEIENRTKEIEARGEARGKARGKEEKAISMAKEMLADRVPIDKIGDCSINCVTENFHPFKKSLPG